MVTTTKTTLAEVLVQAIEGNAEVLRLLDPERYQALLHRLGSWAIAEKLPQDNEAWDDIERWIAEFRRQDIAQVESESENAPVLTGHKSSS